MKNKEKCNLRELVISQYYVSGMLNKSKLPDEYLINHISSTFVETVDWLLSNKMKETPKEITMYFLGAINPLFIDS